MTKSERSNYKTLDFAGWSEAKTLVLTPKFQRRTVWTAGARSFFIDTLIREMPVPPIFLRIRQSDDKKKIVREVVDGQQRLSSALSFTKDEFKLSKSLDKRWANKRFSELDSAFQDNINNFSFICEVFQVALTRSTRQHISAYFSVGRIFWNKPSSDTCAAIPAQARCLR